MHKVGLYLGSIRMGYTSRIALTNFTKTRNVDNAHMRNVTNYFTITYMFQGATSQILKEIITCLRKIL